MQLAVLIFRYFPYGGLQRDCARLIARLQERGHSCRLYCGVWEGDPLPGVEVRLAPESRGSNVRRDQRFFEWVQGQLAQEPPDGVIGFNKMPGLDIYFAGDPCYRDKALRERNFIYRLGRRFRHFSAWERAVFSPAASTRILLISAAEQRKFERHYHTPAARMHLLPPGVAPDRRRPSDAVSRRAAARHRLGLTHDVFTLMLVGSGFITKGLDRAIRALASLQTQHPGRRMRLLVAGHDRVGRFGLLARRQQVQDQVEFLGGRDDIADLMLAADVLVHPARSEAGGVVLLEALVAGLPVVATGVCGYSHHIEAAAAGEVLPEPFEQAALTTALAGLLDSAYRDQCRGNGLAYADSQDLYSMHSAAADWVEQIIDRSEDAGLG